PLAAFVTGGLAERGFDRRYLTFVLAMIAGLAVVFGGGVTWLAVTLRSVPAALSAGFYPFILADFAKLLVAAGIMPGLWRITGSAR
ncbi:MAG TPA: biotin transporter BioY, partial [Vicinamibacterales bacterium]|nr:biotin transporter BioY [Vicinamibacterales bacterium]